MCKGRQSQKIAQILLQILLTYAPLQVTHSKPSSNNFILQAHLMTPGTQKRTQMGDRVLSPPLMGSILAGIRKIQTG
jgi:hypothetical protein